MFLSAIEKGVAASVTPTVPTTSPAAPRMTDNREERVPMSRLRRLIASRLKEAYAEYCSYADNL